MLLLKDSLVINFVLRAGADSQTVTVEADPAQIHQAETATQLKKPPPRQVRGQQTPLRDPPNWVNFQFSGRDFSGAGALLVSGSGAYVLYSSDAGTTWTSHIPPSISYPGVRGPG